MKTYHPQPTVTAEAAQAIIASAVAKAQELNQAFSITILDVSGNLKAFHSMDGAPLLSLSIAKDKAYTAIGYRIPSHQWYDLVKDDPALSLGVPGSIDRLIILGGGYPLVVDNTVIGAIGVSGGHYKDDMQVAEAGLKALDQEAA
jgi:uncharacterized protein GlcG (DUF336 family)